MAIFVLQMSIKPNEERENPADTKPKNKNPIARATRSNS
jgi:hypothetical protein